MSLLLRDPKTHASSNLSRQLLRRHVRLVPPVNRYHSAIGVRGVVDDGQDPLEIRFDTSSNTYQVTSGRGKGHGSASPAPPTLTYPLLRTILTWQSVYVIWAKPMLAMPRTATRTVPAAKGAHARPSAIAATHSVLYCSGSSVVASKRAGRPSTRYSIEPLSAYTPSGSGSPAMMAAPSAGSNVAERSFLKSNAGYPSSRVISSQLMVCDNPVAVTETAVIPSRRLNPFRSGSATMMPKSSNAMLYAGAAVPGRGSDMR